MISFDRKSPDKPRQVRFCFEGEIKFGPAYYRVQITERVPDDRIYGDAFQWSPNSRFLALQEWLTTDYQKGPKTALRVFDFLAHREAQVSWADGGFITPLRFEDATLVYEKRYLAAGKIAEYEIDLDGLDRWESVQWEAS
jgi:hypothetical protein